MTRKPRADSEAFREKTILHVQSRAWERLGVALTKREIIELSLKCASGEFGAPGNVTHHGRQHFGGEIRGHSVRLIYCPTLQLIKTLYQRPLGRKRGDKVIFGVTRSGTQHKGA